MHKKVLLILSAIIAIILFVILVCFFWYQNALKAVGEESTKIIVEVEEGSTYTTLASTLYDKKLIKSTLAYRIYLKLNPPQEGLKAGTYEFHQGMDVKEILATLEKGGTSISLNQISITFPEGINMRKIASIIAENTNNTEEDVFSLLENQEYLEGLITKYWFIDRSILDENIYYPLEGYLFPDTYFFEDQDVTVSEIFEVLLDEMENKLEPYRSAIAANDYSIHEILTLASIVELESPSNNNCEEDCQDNRAIVAGVFFNRLRLKMSLGSDVTTYYGAQVDMSERDLLQAEIDALNGYNTRPAKMAGKLPVGPICSPSLESIQAVLNPEETEYLYFVSDKYQKLYFTKTNAEHEALVSQLKDEGLWYEY